MINVIVRIWEIIMDKQLLAAIFNEWNRRYSENPDEFSNSLDENGKPIEDYGENCAAYFLKLEEEIAGEFVDAHL